MLSEFLVLGGVLVGLFVLLALIVSLSARPQPGPRRDTVGAAPARPARTWAADAGRPHPDAWSPMPTTSTSEIPAIH